jgi:Flp pilus assembly protein TadG
MMRALNLHHDDTGTSILELAVVLPVLMTIGLGAIEFGNVIYRQHMIANGVRDAARYAAGLYYDPANPTANDSRIRNMATNGIDTGGTARVSGWTASAVTVVFATVSNGLTSCGTSQCYRGPTSLPVVTVSTSYNYQTLGFLGFLGITGSVSLGASHQERVIGVR